MEKGEMFYWVDNSNWPAKIKKMIYYRQTKEFVYAIDTDTLFVHQRTLDEQQAKGLLLTKVVWDLVFKSDYVRIPKEKVFYSYPERDAQFESYSELTEQWSSMLRRINDCVLSFRAGGNNEMPKV